MLFQMLDFNLCITRQSNKVSILPKYNESSYTDAACTINGKVALLLVSVHQFSLAHESLFFLCPVFSKKKKSSWSINRGRRSLRSHMNWPLTQLSAPGCPHHEDEMVMMRRIIKWSQPLIPPRHSKKKSISAVA
jgi:hypothetical protein